MITTTSSSDYTYVALRSLVATTILNSEVQLLIIDNDATFELPEHFKSPFITVTHNTQPRGFATNINVAMRKALLAQQDLYLLNNDLVFAPRWIEMLGEDPNTVVSPLSNREVQYGISTVVPSTSRVVETFVTSSRMDISQYQRDASLFSYLMDQHQRNVPHSIMPVLVVPFFCVRIPFEVYSKVGAFDEGFGNGGGEDYDYCLRAHLLGFQVVFQLRQFLFHFGGKSSWDGGIAESDWKQHAASFSRYFMSKWGEKLTNVILHETPLADVIGTEQIKTELRTDEALSRLIRDLCETLPSLICSL